MNQQKIARYFKLSMWGILGPAILIIVFILGVMIFGLTSYDMTERFSCLLSVGLIHNVTFYTIPTVCSAFSVTEYILIPILIISVVGMLIVLRILNKKSSSSAK